MIESGVSDPETIPRLIPFQSSLTKRRKVHKRPICSYRTEPNHQHTFIMYKGFRVVQTKVCKNFQRRIHRQGF